MSKKDQSAADPLRGALAGLAAGLVASLAMDLAQRAYQSVAPVKGDDDDDDGAEPATEQAADRVSRMVGGRTVPDDTKSIAGQAVHYAFGASLGLAYGVLAEYWPAITAGRGSAFGLGSALLFDEAAVPAAGLGPAPWDAPAATHAYSAASHLVFGTATEATRRIVRTAL